jgi:hypothetical protein
MDSLSPSHPSVPRIAAGVQASFEAMVAQQRALAESDRVRRDLLEDLLVRRLPSAAGLKRTPPRTTGLGPDTRLLVTAEFWPETCPRV